MICEKKKRVFRYIRKQNNKIKVHFIHFISSFLSYYESFSFNPFHTFPSLVLEVLEKGGYNGRPTTRDTTTDHDLGS